MTIYRTLIDAGTLAANLDAGGWRIVDCRFDLADPDAGRKAWQAAHIPGAVYADLEKDLSGKHDAAAGRHPLPARDDLVELFNELGISNDSQVVAYDDKGGAFAARLWWLLRWLGHERVAVLDGGWPAWKNEGLPVSNAPVPPPRGCFVAHEPLVATASADEILADLNHENLRLLDARSPERYRGDVEPIDPVAGHIPGAENRPFTENLDAEGRFLSADALRERFEGSREPVHYCGSGVTACHNLLAMDVAGLPAGRLYPGSWSGWISDETRPVKKGEE